MLAPKEHEKDTAFVTSNSIAYAQQGFHGGLRKWVGVVHDSTISTN